VLIRVLIIGSILIAASAAFAMQQEDVDPGDGYVEPAQPQAGVAPENRICPLTDEKPDEAIIAFSRMMPALSHPRCSNCHGGVNPFSENGGHAGGEVKIGNLAERWLKDRLALIADLTRENGAKLTQQQIKNAEDALRTIESAKGESLSVDAIAGILAEGGLEQAVAAGACASCHAHQPVHWRVASSRFAGLSQKQMCESFQKHRDVTSPAEFVEHMSRDPLEFIPVAFEGTRALTPFGQAIYKEVRGRAYAPEPIASTSRTAMNRAAFDWGTALGGKFRKPASCGCEKKTYKLDIHIKFIVDYDSGAEWGNVGADQKFQLPIKFIEEGKFVAKGATTLKNVVDSGVGADSCAVEQAGDEDWALDGVIDPATNEMTIAGSVTTRMKPAMLVCNVDGKRITQVVPGMERTEDLEKYSFKMPALTDAPEVFRDAIPYGERVVTLKVVEAAPPPKTAPPAR
jgi:cytochrome c553